MLFSILLMIQMGQYYQLTPTHTLAPIPEERDVFLQAPASLDVASNGHTYVLDWVARVVFHWDDKGEFVGVIGKPGQGPKEFIFQGMGGPVGYITTLDDKLYVYDGGKMTVMVFDLEGNYIESLKMNFQTGRTDRFFALADGSFAFQNQNFMTKIPTRSLEIYGRDGTFTRKIKELTDETFERENDGTRVTGIIIKGYSATVVSNFNPTNQEIMMGFSGKPAFSLIDLNTGTEANIKVGIVEQDVTQEDKDEFNEVAWVKGNTFFKVGFPEKKAFYNDIIPLEDKGFLVYTLSPHYRNAVGIYVNRQGKTMGRFNFACGENGSLHAAKGRLLGIYLNEDDEFTISNLELTAKQ